MEENYESHTTQGITSDFYWYEITRMQESMKVITASLDHVLNTLQAREQEKLNYVDFLTKKCDRLQIELNAMRKEQENGRRKI